MKGWNEESGTPETAIFCDQCEWPLVCCDFCFNFNYNGIEGIYMDCGFCEFHGLPSEPGDLCEYYFCEFGEEARMAAT